VLGIKCSTLQVDGKPTMVTFDYKMDVASLSQEYGRALMDDRLVQTQLHFIFTIGLTLDLSKPASRWLHWATRRCHSALSFADFFPGQVHVWGLVWWHLPSSSLVVLACNLSVPSVFTSLTLAAFPILIIYSVSQFPVLDN